MKRNQTIFLLTVSSITIVLLVLGFVFQQTTAERINGFFGMYDATDDGTIAYVIYDKSIPTIYLQKNQQTETMYTGKVDEKIVDLYVDTNLEALYFISGNQNKVDHPETSVIKLTIDTQEFETVFQSDNYINEIAFDSEDATYLYYIQSKAVTNYSPIAPKNPHEMDVYRYHLAKDEHSKLTHLNAYSMTSLHVVEEEETIYIQTEDITAETAEDIFELPETVYRIPYNDQRNMEAVRPPTWDRDIVGMGLLPNNQGMVFSGVHNSAEGGVFEYELFYYEWDAADYQRLTDFEGNATRAIIRNEQDLYFTVDLAFAKKNSDYRLYKMNLQDKKFDEIRLNH